MLTVCIIDSFPVARQGISVLLHKHFAPVQLILATSILDLNLLDKPITPHLIILGINDPETSDHLNGQSVKTLLDCKTQFSSVPLVVFEDTCTTGNISSYFRLGVKGHLLKKCLESEFVKCIERVLAGKYYLSPDLHVRSLFENDVDKSTTDDPKNKLSLRERQIAKYLSKGERTMSIAKLLNCSPSAVSNIKRKILHKLEVSNTVELVGKLNGSDPSLSETHSV
jgi:DNA-binding NarL/FixJ family response regulator